MKQDIEFKSKGDVCRGWLMTPDGPGPFPTVVMGGGWCYVKEIVMPSYAEYLLQAGLAAILFDYRNFGSSDGEPRQHVDPWRQVEDYKNAISFAETLPQVDVDRIGIWGISYAGGHVLIVGALDARVRCIVSIVAVVDGETHLHRAHGERRYAELLDLIAADRKRRFEQQDAGGTIPMSVPDPETTLSTWSHPAIHEVFTHLRDTEAPSHVHANTIESVELLRAYNVFPYARRILNTPTLMVVAENDNIAPWDLQIDAFNSIAAPKKKLAVIPDVTHMSLYSERTHLEIAGQEGAAWFREHIVP